MPSARAGMDAAAFTRPARAAGAPPDRRSGDALGGERDVRMMSPRPEPRAKNSVRETEERSTRGAPGGVTVRPRPRSDPLEEVRAERAGPSPSARWTVRRVMSFRSKQVATDSSEKTASGHVRAKPIVGVCRQSSWVTLRPRLGQARPRCGAGRVRVWASLEDPRGPGGRYAGDSDATRVRCESAIGPVPR